MMQTDLADMIDKRRALARRLRFCDANVWLGAPEGFPNAAELLPAQLGQALRSYHLCGGLVSHWWGRTLSAQDGNRALLEVADGLPEGMWCTWTGLPLLPEDEGPLPGHPEVPARVRAVRLFPRMHNFPLTGWCVGSLCAWLVERRLPLFIWHTETDWPSVHDLARAFPELAVVLETQVQKILYHTRPLFALMRQCPSVHVELSNFAGQGFVEYVVRQFGPERLLYGSFLPVSDPWVPMGMVLDAQIPEADKALIAGENLRRLVAGAAG
jgi:hypothetical protein